MVHITLNRDVYAYIVTFLSSTKDLLALCLANKEFKDLAEPEMVYRTIRCRLDNTAVWEHLAKNPGYASRVRRLEVQRQNPSQYILNEKETMPNSRHLVIGRRAPTDDHSPESVESAEYLLVQAVRNMVNLESFVWDRWVPFINQGDDILHSNRRGNSGSGTYDDDIWTVLRNRTKIDTLKVVDLGRMNMIIPDCRPIFNSALFTIRNLVVLELKIYHSPDSEAFDLEDFVLGRVNIERIQDLLRHCSNLENLTLAIIDRPYHFGFHGNPYTDITRIISTAYWPRLTSLQLQDIIADNITMIYFLWRHPTIRRFSASLSLAEEDGPPDVPFSFESAKNPLRGILPNLEHVDLPPSVLRPFLRSVNRPTNLRSIQHIESGDWASDDNSPIDSTFLTTLDDIWGPPSGHDIRGSLDEEESEGQQESQELLAGMPKLRLLSVAYISTLRQLEKLCQLTPDLEHLMIADPAVRYDVRMVKHKEIIQYISQWKNLVSFRGPCLWPLDEDTDIWITENISSIGCEIVLACPNLRYLSWIDGRVVEILKSNEGEFVGLDIVNFPSFVDKV